MAQNKVYGYTELTGGGTDALDAEDGAILSSGDAAIVKTGGNFYFYNLDAGSGATEASPHVIAPDTNAGTKRWVLQGISAYMEQTEFLPEREMDDDTSGSATSASSAIAVDSGLRVRVRNIWGSQGGYFLWMPPSDIYSSGTIKYRVHSVVTTPEAPISGAGVAFKLGGFAVGAQDSISAAAVTEYVSTTGALPAGYAQYDVFVTGWSSAMTIRDLTPGEIVSLKFRRDNTVAEDTYNSAAGVMGIELKYERLTKRLA